MAGKDKRKEEKQSNWEKYKRKKNTPGFSLSERMQEINSGKCEIVQTYTLNQSTSPGGDKETGG